LDKGEDTDSAEDWDKAWNYFVDHPREIIAWKLKRKIRRFWQSLQSFLALCWRIFIFPLWLLWKLPELFAQDDTRSFAYNQALSLNPKLAEVHNNRGTLKVNLNDLQGALADFNQAISFSPKYALAYFNRGALKYNKLDDRRGAIEDFRTAAHLFRANGQIRERVIVIDILRQLGTTETP
jgi:tetratricopeptide (TPR) repeat protein